MKEQVSGLEIWSDPNRQDGAPCIKGTRVTVKLVLWAIEQTGSIEGALKSYPHLTEQQVKDALYYAQELLDECESLRRDKERLDWLDAQKNNGDLEVCVGGPWRWMSEDRPAVGVWKIDSRPDLGKYETAREAIDAAISENAARGE